MVGEAGGEQNRRGLVRAAPWNEPPPTDIDAWALLEVRRALVVRTVCLLSFFLFLSFCVPPSTGPPSRYHAALDCSELALFRRPQLADWGSDESGGTTTTGGGHSQAVLMRRATAFSVDPLPMGAMHDVTGSAAYLVDLAFSRCVRARVCVCVCVCGGPMCAALQQLLSRGCAARGGGSDCLGALFIASHALACCRRQLSVCLWCVCVSVCLSVRLSVCLPVCVYPRLQACARVSVCCERACACEWVPRVCVECVYVRVEVHSLPFLHTFDTANSCDTTTTTTATFCGTSGSQRTCAGPSQPSPASPSWLSKNLKHTPLSEESHVVLHPLCACFVCASFYHASERADKDRVVLFAVVLHVHDMI